ncbi:MAG TPA: hypothetical protein DEG88_10800 [Propionibacteriaceae bacterium]|nr:hypothetical protein [Propionibacteriaceae bacterium]
MFGVDWDGVGEDTLGEAEGPVEGPAVLVDVGHPEGQLKVGLGVGRAAAWPINARTTTTATTTPAPIPSLRGVIFEG